MTRKYKINLKKTKPVLIRVQEQADKSLSSTSWFRNDSVDFANLCSCCVLSMNRFFMTERNFQRAAFLTLMESHLPLSGVELPYMVALPAPLIFDSASRWTKLVLLALTWVVCKEKRKKIRSQLGQQFLNNCFGFCVASCWHSLYKYNSFAPMWHLTSMKWTREKQIRLCSLGQSLDALMYY